MRTGVGRVVLVDIILKVELDEPLRIRQLVGNRHHAAIFGAVAVGAVAVNFGQKPAGGIIGGGLGVLRQGLLPFLEAHLDDAGIEVQIEICHLVGLKVRHRF